MAITVGLGLAAAAALAVLDSPLGKFTAGEGAAAPDTTVVALPPASAPALKTAPPPLGTAPPAAAPPAPAPPTAAASPQPAPAPPPAAAEASPALPTIAVPPRSVHSVPNDEPPVPTVTLLDRKGRTIKEIKPSTSVAAAPASAALAPPPPAAAPGAMPTPVTFNGAAQAAGATVLTVGGRSVRLFGVRVADPRDHCGLGTGDNRSCADVARDALTQRLRHYPNAACHVPPGQRGSPAAICTDSSGTDLGGFLVAEGYVLADTSQSYDYYGAEGIARSFRRGLWRNR
ncbi:MAG TPA: hypothetical protein VGL83_16370 [Stellaceae bacterium]